MSKNDADDLKKRPKSTITLKKPAAGADTPPKAPSERRYSTRAKAAARRDGRTLFEPTPPGTRAPKDPLATPAKPSAARVPRPPRDAQSVDATKTARKPATGRGGAATTSTRTSAGARTGAAEDQTRRRPRTTSSDAFVPLAKTTRTFAEPKRGGKLRDQVARDERAARPVVNTVKAVPAEPREVDGKVRVSKLLSEQGLCSRREADSYIARGWVWADGVRVTELGTRVLPTAKLKLDQNAMAMQDQRVTVLLHKPVGYVSGQAEDGYQPASVLVLPEHQIPDDVMAFRHEHRRGMAPAGRLDIDSTGLLVLTQDGRVAKQLIGENSEVEKEYLVRVEGELSAEGLALLNNGLSLDGEALRPAQVKWQNKDQLNFILREGKKRQIRRMCEAVGLNVVGLKRIRIGRVMLGDLPVGKWRYLREDEAF